MEKKIHHILIVEDDDLMRDELSHAFSENGYGVSTARNGDEALNIAFNKKPELIILDVLMPHTNGLDILRQLRGDDNGKNIPVLILSNVKDEASVAEAVELGGCDYLLKTDWSLEDVLKKVNEKLK